MSDKAIVLKIDEPKILEVIGEMCDESLPPDLHNNWDEIRDCLINTRRGLSVLRSDIKVLR